MKLIIQNQMPLKQAMIDIYHYSYPQWILEGAFKIKGKLDLKKLLMESGINYGLIDLNSTYQRVLYELYPSILLIIKPQALKALVFEAHLERCHQLACDEVAIGEEQSFQSVLNSPEQFLNSFYNSPTREIALLIYNKWQYERVLNDPVSNKLIRMMNFYLEEILNYFDFKWFLEGVL